MDKLPITKLGFSALEEEHKKLKFEDRPAVIDDIAEAREHGDLKENAEYHAAREKQGFIEGRIKALENYISKAEIIDPKNVKAKTIVFSATVKIVDDNTEEEKTYQIVGEYESSLENGKISITSPIAKALIGKEEGDIVNVVTPGGKKTYEIVSVNYI
jgi:transcription elongation factor GreA